MAVGLNGNSGGDMNKALTGSELTPMQRLRQLEPSWLRSGQTTSLFASVMEKDDVRDDLGGIFEPRHEQPGVESRQRGVGGGCSNGQLLSYRIARWSEAAFN